MAAVRLFEFFGTEQIRRDGAEAGGRDFPLATAAVCWNRPQKIPDRQSGFKSCAAGMPQGAVLSRFPLNLLFIAHRHPL